MCAFFSQLISIFKGMEISMLHIFLTLVFAIFSHVSNGSNCTELSIGNLTLGVLNDLKYQDSIVKTINSTGFLADGSVTMLFVDMNEMYHVVKTVNKMQSSDIDLLAVNTTDSATVKMLTYMQATPNVDAKGLIDSHIRNSVNENGANPCMNNVISVTSQEDSVVNIPCQNFNLLDNIGENFIIGIMTTSVIKHLKWSVVIIFYESSTEHLMDVVSLETAKEGVFLRIYNMDVMNDSALRQSFDEVYSSMVEVFINVTVICHIPCVQRVILMADHYDTLPGNNRRTALRDHSSWFILTSSNDFNMEVFSENLGLDNVFLLDLSLSSTLPSTEINTESVDYLLWSLTNLTGVEGNETVADSFETLKIELQKALGTYPCHTYELSTLMWVTHGHDPALVRQWNNIGTVSINGSLVLCKNCNMFPNRQFGLNKRKWLVATRWWPPFTERVQVNGTTIGYSGFCTDLLNELTVELNFTYDWVEPPDGEWGTLMDNGSWTGMIGQLERREVDLMVAAISIQADREQAMDFTHPFYYDVSTILMKRPDEDDSKILTLMKPFKWEVFVSLACVLPASAIILSLVERITPYYRIHGREGRQNFQMSFWYMFGAILSQGGESLPNSVSGRTMISFFWLFSILFVGTYCGNLIAFLTVSIEKPPFQSMAEMIEQDRYKWGTLGGTYFITWFSKSQLSILQSVWAGIVKNNQSDSRVLHPDPNVHIDKILNEKYVYLGDKVYMDLRTYNDCRLMTAEEEFPNMQYGVGLPNNSLHTKLFSNKIMELHESGIFELYKQKHWPTKQICPGMLIQHAEEIDLVDIQSAFYLIGIGILVGGLCLGTEFLIYWWRVKCRGLQPKDPCRHLRTTSTVDLEEYAGTNGSCNGRTYSVSSSINGHAQKELYQRNSTCTFDLDVSFVDSRSECSTGSSELQVS